MDAHGYDQAQVAKITGLSPQHVSQLVNRTTRYSRPPTIPKMQALTKIPGMSIEMVAMAVWESMGLPMPAKQSMTPLRKSVIAVVEKIPERRLGEALKHLAILLGG